MTALAQLAYLRNGMEATHWHALKRLVRNELLVEYFTVGESACHTTSPLRALYELPWTMHALLSTASICPTVLTAATKVSATLHRMFSRSTVACPGSLAPMPQSMMQHRQR